MMVRGVLGRLLLPVSGNRSRVDDHGPWCTHSQRARAGGSHGLERDAFLDRATRL